MPSNRFHAWAALLGILLLLTASGVGFACMCDACSKAPGAQTMTSSAAPCCPAAQRIAECGACPACIFSASLLATAELPIAASPAWDSPEPSASTGREIEPARPPPRLA